MTRYIPNLYLHVVFRFKILWIVSDLQKKRITPSYTMFSDTPDACVNQFTDQQGLRMHASIARYNNTLMYNQIELVR